MKTKSIIHRITNFFEKPILQRNKIFFRKIKSSPTLIFHFLNPQIDCGFFAYQPDSQRFFEAHPEFHVVLKKFVMFNRLNNAGDITRLWSLVLNIKQIIEEKVEGDFAELGVWRGNTAAVLAYYGQREKRRVFLFDTFQGFNKKDLDGIDSDKKIAFHDTSLGMVKEVIGVESGSCEFVTGYFPESINENHRRNRYAIVSLDCDLYEPMKEGLSFFYPLMSPGGIFFLHDYSSFCWNGSKKAIDEFCKKNNENLILMPDKSGSAFIRKTRKGI
jgi:hypothetical protein